MCYGPRDTSGISNKTVETRPRQTGRRDGTNRTMGRGVAKLYTERTYVLNVLIY
jgi:hypothetical protein